MRKRIAGLFLVFYDSAVWGMVSPVGKSRLMLPRSAADVEINGEKAISNLERGHPLADG